MIYPIRSFIRSLILPIKKIDQVIPISGDILDIGCGSGSATIFFALSGPLRQITGSDIDSNNIIQAQKITRNIKNIKFISQSLYSPNAMYDAVVAIDLLHHLSPSNLNYFFDNIKQIIKPGGLLIIKEMNTSPKYKFIINLIHDKIIYNKLPTTYLSADDLRQTLTNLNFQTIDIQDISNIFYAHYLCVAKI